MQETCFDKYALRLRHGEEFFELTAVFDGIHIVWYLVHSDAEGNLIRDEDEDDLGFGRFQVEVAWRLEERLQKLGAMTLFNTFQIFGYGSVPFFEGVVSLAILDEPVPPSKPDSPSA